MCFCALVLHSAEVLVDVASALLYLYACYGAADGARAMCNLVLLSLLPESKGDNYNDSVLEFCAGIVAC